MEPCTTPKGGMLHSKEDVTVTRRTLEEDFRFCKHEKNTWPIQVSKLDVPTWFFPWPTRALPKVLCGKTHHHDAKSTCPEKNLVSFI
jgi:hypothetical protein